MVGQHISLNAPNDSWINSLLASDEYSANGYGDNSDENARKSEIVNDLINKARAQQDKINYIRAKLRASEKSGFTTLTKDEILAKSKEELRRNGKL